MNIIRTLLGHLGNYGVRYRQIKTILYTILVNNVDYDCYIDRRPVYEMGNTALWIHMLFMNNRDING